MRNRQSWMLVRSGQRGLFGSFLAASIILTACSAPTLGSGAGEGLARDTQASPPAVRSATPTARTASSPAKPRRFQGLIIATDCVLSEGPPIQDGTCVHVVDTSESMSQLEVTFPRVQQPNATTDETTPQLIRHRFDPQFRRMVAAEPQDGHVGWVDQVGHFTDVSGRLPEDSDFIDASVSEGMASFAVDGSFWFVIVDDTHRMNTVYRLAPSESIPRRQLATSRELRVSEDGSIGPVVRVPFTHSLPFVRVTRDGRGCHAPADVSESGLCVGIAGFSGDPQHVATVTPYRASAVRIDGVDRSREVFDLRGNAITPATERILRDPVFDSSGEAVGFIATDGGADPRVYIASAGNEPRRLEIPIGVGPLGPWPSEEAPFNEDSVHIIGWR